MGSTIVLHVRRAAVAAAVVAGVAGSTFAVSPAQAAVTVRVESQITAHDLPYLNSPYVEGSVLLANQYASVECYTRGREYIGGTVMWYRIDSLYYPAYAFTNPAGIVPCGINQVVPLAANGYSSPSFSSPAAEGWFTSNEAVKVLCTASGQLHEGSNAWFFTKGYWLHSSRLSGDPNGGGYSTCRGYTRPGAVSAVIAAASSMINQYPYSWGGGGKSGPSYGVCCSPSGRDGTNVYGFDCSGLTQYAFWHGARIEVGGDSRSQYNGYKVSLSQRQAGDMIFWSDSSLAASKIHHVALYVGGGQIIEATPNSGSDIRKRTFSTGENGVMPYVVRPIH